MRFRCLFRKNQQHFAFFFPVSSFKNPFLLSHFPLGAFLLYLFLSLLIWNGLFVRKYYEKVALISEVSEVDIWLDVCRITTLPNRSILCGFTMWISAGQPMWTTGDIFSGVYKDPASAIMVTPQKWKEVISQHCGDCLSGKARFNPHNLSIVHSSSKQQLWYQFTVPRCSLSLGLWSDLLYF